MKTEVSFWDSSAIVPLCCYQPASHFLRQRLRRHQRLVVWWRTLVEAHSALARLVREGKLSSEGFKHALNRLELLRRAWVEVSPSDHVREEATRRLDVYPLRAADALQLAAAKLWCNQRPRKRHFICCDVRLAEAAAAAGFTVVGVEAK